MELHKINDLAKQYFDQKDFQSALNVLTSAPLPPELIPNLAKCYYYTRQAHRALELIKPLHKNHNLWIDQALYHNAIGETQQAYEIYKSLDKSDPKVKFNMGWHLLAENKFKEGFDHLQYGAECNAWGHEYMHVRNGVLNPKKRWCGNPCDHLILLLEGGLGDEIIFLRWANHLKSKCDKLSVVCSEGLMRLLTNSGYNCIPFYALNHIEYDYYCPAMSLPTITELHDPQDQVQFPYITSFAEPYITNQLDRLVNGRLKIGIRFYGNSEFEHDQFRTPPRDALLELGKYGQLFSVQIDEDSQQIPNCKHLIKDWQDTYSVFKALDVLVTSCTSTAHLAGAMGLRAIVLVPFVPYFVWASDTMNWYPDHITVIRQSKYNCWNESVEKLNNELSRFCNFQAQGQRSSY